MKYAEKQLPSPPPPPHTHSLLKNMEVLQRQYYYYYYRNTLDINSDFKTNPMPIKYAALMEFKMSHSSEEDETYRLNRILFNCFALEFLTVTGTWKNIMRWCQAKHEPCSFH